MGLWAKILFVLFFGSHFLYAQDKPELEYQVKATFLYNFTRFVTWPSSAFSAPDAPLVIAIVGEDPFGTYLEELVAGVKVSNRQIVVQRYEDSNNIGSCHIAFVNFEDPLKIKETLAAFDAQKTLAVSDATSFSRLGGQVQFIKEKGKIRVQINMAAANRLQLEISSKLLRTAKIIK